MYKVICIIGKSGVGKSILANEICKDKKFHFVKSYTTRKVRINDPEDKETHIFVSKDFREKAKEVMVEYINVEKNYCSWVDKTLFDENKINIFVVDIDAFLKLNKRKDMNVKCVYLQLLEEERKERYRNRNKELVVPQDKRLSIEYLLAKQPEIKSEINIINANKKTPSEIKDDVLEKLRTFTKI